MQTRRKEENKKQRKEETKEKRSMGEKKGSFKKKQQQTEQTKMMIKYLLKMGIKKKHFIAIRKTIIYTCYIMVNAQEKMNNKVA